MPAPALMTSHSRSERIAALRNTAAELKQRLEQEAKRLGLSLLNSAGTEEPHPSSSGVSNMESEGFRGQLPGRMNIVYHLITVADSFVFLSLSFPSFLPVPFFLILFLLPFTYFFAFYFSSFFFFTFIS